jgi:predicted DNA-binding transcriptional regulator AlpA
VTTDRAWTVADIADYFQVSDRQVRRWRATELTFPAPLALPGRTQRWDPGAVVAWSRAEAA